MQRQSLQHQFMAMQREPTPMQYELMARQLAALKQASLPLEATHPQARAMHG